MSAVGAANLSRSSTTYHSKMPPPRDQFISKLHPILFLCILACGSLSAASYQDCNIDGDCPFDHYCYMITKVCAPCIPNYCRRYNRQNRYKMCPAEPEDCGQCLPGYEEEDFSDGTKRASCIISHPPTPGQTLEHMSEGTHTSTRLNNLIGLPLVALIILFIACKRMSRPVNRISQPEETELKLMQTSTIQASNNQHNNAYAQATAPILPEYSPEDPLNSHQNESAWPVEESPSNSYEHTFEIKRNPSPCLLLQSAMFRKPNYEEDNAFNFRTVDNNNGGSQTSEEEEDPENHEGEEISLRERQPVPPVQYHDETTMPSEWTPGPALAEEENSTLSSSGTERPKRTSTEMVSSESEDEHSSKRVCNNSDEDSETNAPCRYQNFTTALSSIRQSQNNLNNNNQNKNPDVNSDPKDN